MKKENIVKTHEKKLKKIDSNLEEIYKKLYSLDVQNSDLTSISNNLNELLREKCTRITLTDTGKMWERFHLCGKRIWKYWIRNTVELTCLMKTGRSTAGTVVCRDIRSAPEPM